MALKLSIEALKDAKFRGPIAFYDGKNGMARQDFECIEEPRFSYSWRRENSCDKGRQFYMVDGKEVEDLAEACKLLALPPASDSPVEQFKRKMDELSASPKLNYGATRALLEARCNADVGAFGTMRAWMHRTYNAIHDGINKFSNIEQEAGREFPHWLYRIKSGAHEVSRAIYLFKADAKKDTGLMCALGKRCRDCLVLSTIEASMIEARTRGPFSRDIEDVDIHSAKSWICVGHILSENAKVINGEFLSTKESRSNSSMGR
ncbi:MAG: hypothetical protein GKS00_10825 [Alphaproteobacteria bacterium]|nr:hypothetical protein [Alphaproteobacteria bacterium]